MKPGIAEFPEEIRTNWRVAIIGLGVLFFGFAAPAYALPFIYPEIIAEFGWSRSEAVSLASVKYLTGVVACILIGRLIDVIGVWRSLLGCIVLGALALASFQAVNDLNTYLAVGVLLGFAGSGAMVSVYVLVARGFRNSQGTATGFVLLGTGLGGFLMPIIVSSAVEAFGWRDGMMILSLGIWLIAVPLLVYGVRHIKLPIPDAAPDEFHSPQNVENGVLRHLSTLAKTRSFWLMTIAFFAVTMADQAFTQHQVLMFRDALMSERAAALAVSAIGLFSMFGRIAVGTILDAWSNKGLAALYCCLSLSAILAMTLVSPAVLCVFIVMRALAHASVMVDGPVIARHTFGTAHLGVVVGVVTATASLGSAIGPWLMGTMFDARGSYDVAILLCVVMSGLSALMIYFVVPEVWLRRRDSEQAAASLLQKDSLAPRQLATNPAPPGNIAN